MKKIFALALAAAAVFSVQAQDVKEMYESAKKLDDAFNKAKPTQMSPDRQVDAPTAKGLLDCRFQRRRSSAFQRWPAISRSIYRFHVERRIQQGNASSRLYLCH